LFSPDTSDVTPMLTPDVRHNNGLFGKLVVREALVCAAQPMRKLTLDMSDVPKKLTRVVTTNLSLWDYLYPLISVS
jgi:hypothetical protein